MMTPRDADTLEAVIGEMIDLIGAKRLAAEIGKSATLIYDAASESSSYMLGLPDLLALDHMCWRQHQVAPFYRWQGRQLPKVSNGDRSVSTVETELLDVVERLGPLTGDIKQARHPDGDGGERITRGEGKGIKARTKMIRDALDDIDRAVDAEADAQQIVHDWAGERERRKGSAAE